MSITTGRTSNLAETQPLAEKAGGNDLRAGSLNNDEEQSFVVGRTSLTSDLTVVGTIVPGNTDPVVAPFDGIVRSISFVYGRQVEAGQVLLMMDSSEVEQRRRDAESGYLKAEQIAHEVISWNTGPEVSRAKRSVTAAQQDLKATQHKLVETKTLLDRGLVARSEYEGLIQQEQAQEMALVAATEELATTTAHGQGENRTIALLEFENAKARLSEIDVERSNSVVKATAAGILLRPPSDKADSGSTVVHAGQRVTKGQFIGVIAKASGLAVAFKLNEADANRVHEGQPVTVTGPGFEDIVANGHISSVAGEATISGGGGGDGGSSFEANAIMDAPPSGELRKIRMGMSANVTISIYHSTSAIVIPPQAIEGASPHSVVRVRDTKSGMIRQVFVNVGAVTPDGVEILSGLKPGDTVVWRQAPVALPNTPSLQSP